MMDKYRRFYAPVYWGCLVIFYFFYVKNILAGKMDWGIFFGIIIYSTTVRWADYVAVLILGATGGVEYFFDGQYSYLNVAKVAGVCVVIIVLMAITDFRKQGQSQL